MLFENGKITVCKGNVIFLKTKSLCYICAFLLLFFRLVNAVKPILRWC